MYKHETKIFKSATVALLPVNSAKIDVVCEKSAVVSRDAGVVMAATGGLASAQQQQQKQKLCSDVQFRKAH